MLKRSALVIAAAIALNACGHKPKGTTTNTLLKDTTVARDTHTQSNADSVSMQHLDMDIKVDPDKKLISGCALWTISNRNKVKELKLDTYDLTIDSVSVDGVRVKHSLDTVVPHLGSALHIPISDNSTKVMICYKTGKDARALQWLDPQQTHDKKHPFLYTQSESIYARSWLPCPDGPGIRYTYTARVTVPKGLMALMSAENPQQVNDSGIYHFKMDIPVPAYLMALAVGDISFKSIDKRTGVYADGNHCRTTLWPVPLGKV